MSEYRAVVTLRQNPGGREPGTIEGTVSPGRHYRYVCVCEDGCRRYLIPWENVASVELLGEDDDECPRATAPAVRSTGTYGPHWTGHPDGGAAVRAGVDLLIHAQYDRTVFAWLLYWPEIEWLSERPQIGGTVRKAMRLARRPVERHVARRWLGNQLYDDSVLLLTLLDQLAVRWPERARSLLRRALVEIAAGEGGWHGDPYCVIAERFLAGWPAPGGCPQCGEVLQGYYSEEGDDGVWRQDCPACGWASYLARR